MLVGEGQRVQAWAQRAAQRHTLKHGLLLRMQQAVFGTQRRFFGQRRVPGIKCHERLAWLAIDLLIAIEVQQVRVQCGPEGRHLSGQIARRQPLVKGAALGQKLLAVARQDAVDFFQVSQFDAGRVFGQ